MGHRAAEIRAGLKHPVIDGDGHWMEPIPIFLEYLREAGGPGAVDQIRGLWRRNDAWYRSTWPERQHNRLRRVIWWGVTSNTLDKATALLPALLNERLPELGIDFAIIYPSFGLTINAIAQDDLHRAAARAYNRMTADMFAPFAERFAPVAIMPARTPDQAIEELEYAVGQLGFKAIMLRGNQERPIPSAAEGIDPQKAAWYCDNIALDSPHDYDPFWQRCVDLGVAVTQHSGSPRWSDRASISNFTYNHVGHFAESNHAFARGVFLGGVVRRYPTLNFGFMEGGVSWACQMCGDMIEHWEKRRRAGLQHPGTTSVPELRQLIARYGDQRLKASADAIMGSLDAFRPECSLEELGRPEHVSDDFEAAGINSKADVRAVFSGNFYFGCEADDHATLWAFDPRMGVRLRPVFSSDFTHFDVPDFREVIPEAFEAVEKGHMTEQDFREFTFTNAARLHTRNNPGFFKGTVIERAVADELGFEDARVMNARCWRAFIAPLLAAAFCTVAPAQQYPSRPLRIVVPFTPSGSVDVAARALAPPLTKAFGQNVVIDNRPGGSTVIGTELVARAPADGHTMLIAGFTFIANAALRTKLPFDSMRDFVGVARIGTDPYVISVHPSLPVRTAKDIVALARANPGQLTYATNGAGSAQHVTGEMLKQTARIDMIHVPYQGGGPSALAVLGGHVSILISTTATATPHLNTGKLRAIAVTSQTRTELARDVPTLAESGFPEFELTGKLGVFVRSATPKELVERLGAEIVRALQLPEVRESLFKQGISAAPMGPAEYDALIRAEIPKIQKIVRDAGIKLD